MLRAHITQPMEKLLTLASLTRQQSTQSILTEWTIEEFIHDYHICLIAIFNLLLKLISNLKKSHMNI